MATIRTKFRSSSAEGREGALYYQVIHNRVVRQISTGYKLFASEWDQRSEAVIPCQHPAGMERDNYLLSVGERIRRDKIRLEKAIRTLSQSGPFTADDIVIRFHDSGQEPSFNDYIRQQSKYSINSLVYWVTYVHNVVYSFYRSMIYCYINSTQRCAGSIVIDIIPTNGADKRKFFPFAPYFPVTNVIKRYFYPYFPAIIGIKGYSFPYFPYLSGIMKIKTALYSLFSRLDWHKTVVFPCLGEIYEGIRSLSWEIPVT
ncbi:Arm DNA-binding domain-containing protein [Phocaeicola dorei]|uniref:Arm DNA-binding domain-containing protein n=1 Tax=Phocaeicola dorei TaxID=357276 RepID=UPI000AA38A0E|nr:Arm DNA-binding domain-containing protein [Phocaeicola dorei]